MNFLSGFLKKAVYLALFIGFGLGIVGSGLYLYLAPKLPAVEQLRETKLQVPLRVYSTNLKLIGEFGEKRRVPLTLAETPLLFIKAVLAAEDDRFYQHSGVDLVSLLRAASQLLASGEIQSGGSTITMQVARNFFLSRDQTFARKFNEILLALQIERELSKDEILELYINKIFLGNRAYGLGAAAQVYYGLKAQELSLAQLATLAGLPKSPSTKNPLANPEAARIRRDWILGRMLSLAYIDQSQFDAAIQEPVTATYHDLSLDLDAPYVAEMARQFAVAQFGENAYTDGYRIITTIDEQLQLVAQQAVREASIQYDLRHGYRGPEQHIDTPVDSSIEITSHYVAELRKIPTLGGLTAAVVTRRDKESVSLLLATGEVIDLAWIALQPLLSPYINENQTGPEPQSAAKVFKVGDVVRVRNTDKSPDSAGTWQLSQIPEVQAALVAINPDNGAVISLAGGFDFRQSKYNRILQANRQPGSSFKPFFYTTALENGFTPATLINDSPVVFDDSNLENAWRPENSGGEFLGPIRLRKALYLSRNLVSVRLLKSIGVQKAVEGVARFGFDPEKLPKDLSLALGSLSVPPLTIATAYASLANGGYKIEPYWVETITDLNNTIIYQAKPLTVCRKNCQSAFISSTTNEASDNSLSTEAPRIMDERIAYLMDSMLKDVIKRGTATRALVLKREDIAGKTGTTNGPTDVWFAGYSPHIVTTTWLGFDNNANLGRKEFGGTAALPIWIDFMQAALANTPELIRPQPDGIVTLRIDEKTGLRAKPGQADTLFEFFRKEDVPNGQTTSRERNEESSTETSELLPEEMF
jgi:penicillin-binding protein 1A